MLIWTLNYYQKKIQFRDLPVLETLACDVEAVLLFRAQRRNKREEKAKDEKEVEFVVIIEYVGGN